MGGAMYATRDTDAALHNQLLFMQTQRSDGLMPGRVDEMPGGRSKAGGGDQPDGAAFYYNSLQGLYMASPAVDVAWWLSLAARSAGVPPITPHLLQLRSALERYDDWLWTNRNSSACCGLYSPTTGPTASTCCYHNASHPRCCPGSDGRRLFSRVRSMNVFFKFSPTYLLLKSTPCM